MSGTTTLSKSSALTDEDLALLAEAEDKFETARTYICFTRSYYSRALFSLQTVWGGTDTLAVDFRGRLYMNPTFLSKLSGPEMVGVLLHEINHLIRDHGKRLGAREHLVWNIATDMEINGDLIEDGIILPQPHCHPSQIDMPTGELAETYYPKVDQNVIKIQIVVKDGKFEGTIPCQGNCGSIVAGGEDSDSDRQKEAAAEAGAEGLAPHEMDRVVEQTAIAIENHIKNSSTGIGSIPAGLRRWIESRRRPQVDWRRALRKAVRQAHRKERGHDDFTYTRPNRRMPALKVGDPILPSMIKPVPELALVIDTSGSMGEDDLSSALAEAAGIIATVGEIRALSCDAAAYPGVKVRNAKRIGLEGGGGTDMGVGIVAALKGTPIPDVVVVLTDGYTPWPSKKPAKPVVVGLICRSKDHAPDPPDWANTVHIVIKD